MLAIAERAFNPTALAIVLLGSLLVALLQCGRAGAMRAFAALGPLVRADPDQDCASARAVMLKVDEMAQLRGIACADRVRSAHPFVTLALTKLANCELAEQFALWSARELSDRASRHMQPVSFWLTIADSAPALGMAGTIWGLIGMFMAMNDPAAIGPAMAIALLTTLYGVVLSNLIAAPIAGRLAELSRRELAWQQELVERMLTIARREGAGMRRASLMGVA